jgi:5-methylcytosine-specific restriction enzyme A
MMLKSENAEVTSAAAAYAKNMAKYKKLYHRAAWERIRRLHLRMHPLCAMCEAKGITTAAEVVHHVKPHKGDEWLFHFGELQSLCKPCHDGPVQQSEKSGFRRDIGIDGWPLDAKHPALRNR